MTYVPDMWLAPGGSAFGLRKSNGVTAEYTPDQVAAAFDGVQSADVAAKAITSEKLADDVQVGSLATLTTTAKDSAVAAINEVDANADTANTSIGTLASLTTTAKNTIVAAVNEVDANADAKYTKPETGVPAADLAAAVQTSLGKADTAVQPAAIANMVTSTAAGLVVVGGEYTMVADDATAGSATIATGLGTIATAVVQIVDGTGALVGTPPDAVVTFAAGNITVADGASGYSVTDGHKVRWIAFGAAAE